MTISNNTELLLDNGAMLSVLYRGKNIKDLCVLSIETEFYKELGFKTSVDSKYLDVLRDRPLFIERLNITGFDCIDMPPNIWFQDFLPESPLIKKFGEKFLKNSKDYKDRIVTAIRAKKAQFTERCITFLERFNLQNSENIQDLLLIRFYPAKPVFTSNDKLLEAVKDNIFDAYHTVGENGTELIPALVELGGSTNSIALTDNKEVLQAVKNQWFNLIKYERDVFLKNLNSIKKETEQTQESQLQFEEYEALLQNIDRIAIDNCQTVTEVIKVWPAVMQPQPWYVYGY